MAGEVEEKTEEQQGCSSGTWQRRRRWVAARLEEPVWVIEAAGVEAGEVEAGEVEAGEVEAGEVEAGEVEAGEVEAEGAELEEEEDSGGQRGAVLGFTACVFLNTTKPCGFPKSRQLARHGIENRGAVS
jgi:U3 small nucleolar RNA-associated protein 20